MQTFAKTFFIFLITLFSVVSYSSASSRIDNSRLNELATRLPEGSDFALIVMPLTQQVEKKLLMISTQANVKSYYHQPVPKNC
ncbi:hypothetical protein L0B53_09405 [Vibrio sp. SS-MA-C1-2]|uniref:hypothetical protein n=1 Tax=Vibrio sp. SS-MA-C1-2 TaxID=2908646 RepID=UPI001F1F8086|nr:hypothetical protein [Vibrio sp. SS-MA-C1-2]UJF19690.1 hypothetical protein L0B53_09405 [Vibrio sp. SS-MA-C1-2]